MKQKTSLRAEQHALYHVRSVKSANSTRKPRSANALLSTKNTANAKLSASAHTMHTSMNPQSHVHAHRTTSLRKTNVYKIRFVSPLRLPSTIKNLKSATASRTTSLARQNASKKRSVLVHSTLCGIQRQALVSARLLYLKTTPRRFARQLLHV